MLCQSRQHTYSRTIGMPKHKHPMRIHMKQMKTPESALSLMQSWLLLMLKHVQRQQNALRLHHSLHTHPLVLHPTFAAAIPCSCVLCTATAILCSCALCTTACDTCLYDTLSHTTIYGFQHPSSQPVSYYHYSMYLSYTFLSFA